MGDVADWEFDNGLDAWLAHRNGECDQWCPYCEEDGNGGANDNEANVDGNVDGASPDAWDPGL